ncbi:Leukemia inhibitory factor receptor [Merluccius polli]|uniref:Leukemia inhibitory factor receptor n=1 Tax=Merluccius polli TaxID=89951 RepID=A0AA47MIN9_MERPO|nr:Leukemia inhibitory factor receptor [Merluccius polli]
MRCGPQNLKVSPIYSEQKVALMWEDNTFCLLIQDEFAYDVDVLSTDDMTAIDHGVVVVPRDRTGSIHYWRWASPLPLECAHNTFRVRGRYKDQLGISAPSEPQVFPKDRVVEVGSNVTFCCIVPPGVTFQQMTVSSYSNRKTITTQINSQTYAMTVHLHKPSPASGTDVTCNGAEYGACVYAGYPPRDTDLQCETRDLESVECHWRTERKTNSLANRRTLYKLLGRICWSASNRTANKYRCVHNVSIQAQERNWTLTAQNVLGTLELTDRADLTKRVHMFAPQELTSSRIHARNASLVWQWSTSQYNKLNIRCQISLRSNIHTDVKNYSGVGLNHALLQGLTPNLNYAVQVNCGTEEHFWKWSDSKYATFQTAGDIPDALDVWLWRMEDNQTIILWKTPQPSQSHGRILDYEVTWSLPSAGQQETNNSTVVVFPPGNSAAAELDPSREHVVMVTARNSHGRSLPASMVVLRRAPGEVTNVSRIVGRGGGFNLSWPAHPDSSCGYMVAWTPTFTRGTGDWKKVPPGVTHAFITENLTPGVRYSVCVYTCIGGAPQLLERREGYVEETMIPAKQITGLRWEHVGSDVRVSWTAIPPENRTAFVQGYIMYYRRLGAKDAGLNPVHLNVTTDDPEASSLTARGVHVGSYSFAVAALTSVGEGGGNAITLTVNPPSYKSIMAIAVSFSNVLILLLLTTIVAYKNWTCIKQKVYPPVPKPVLHCDWLTLMEDHGHSILNTRESHSSQKENVDVPQVFCNRVAASTEADREGAPFLPNLGANGYYQQQQQQPQRKAMETTTKADVSQSALLSFPPPPPSVFENLLYTAGMPEQNT